MKDCHARDRPALDRNDEDRMGEAWVGHPRADIQGKEPKSRSSALQPTGFLLFSRRERISVLCSRLFKELHDRIGQRSAAFP